MKIYPYTTDDGIIELVRKDELDNALELLREIRDNEVNPQDEADKFLRDHQPSELSKLRADNAELLTRLNDAREAHLHASARGVQTIQRQSVLLDRMATALQSIYLDDIFDLTMREIARQALTTYKSAKSGDLPDPLAEAVKRMEEAPTASLMANFEPCAWLGGPESGVEAIRTRLTRAAKGEQP